MTTRVPTSAPDYEITHTPTPSAMISRLIPLITSDRTIASYVNSHFGTKVTEQRIGELREFRAKSAPTDYGPAIPCDLKQQSKILAERNQRFLRALRQAYPKGIPA